MGVKTKKPDWFDDSVILCTTVGSEAHGPTHGDDHDEMAIFVEPPVHKLGRHEFNCYMARTAWERTGTNAGSPDQPRSQAGDTDYTAYGLGKFFGLMMGGNPSICVPLWTPDDLVIYKDHFGQRLIDYGRVAVHNKKTIKKFLGYANGQYHRLKGQLGQKNVKRPELEEAYGFDTKYAYHIVRLLLQGTELLNTGNIQLPMDSMQIDYLLGIRQGKYTLSEVELDIAFYMRALENALEKASMVPDYPDESISDQFLTDLYLDFWKEKGML